MQNIVRKRLIERRAGVICAERKSSMDYWHKEYTCPFFVWDDKTKVGCEGGRVIFPDKKSAVEFMDRHCASRQNGWKRCSIAENLLNYYERREKENDK